MNSALQCLSNCPEITEYFLKKYYIEHIKKKGDSNVGILSDSFCQLLKHLWWGNQETFSPGYFKHVMRNINHMVNYSYNFKC